MSHYTELERMRGTVEDLSLRKQLLRRQHTDKPILKYDMSLAKPVQLFNAGDAVARHDGQGHGHTGAAATGGAAHAGSPTTHNGTPPQHSKLSHPKKARGGSGGQSTSSSSPARGVENPYKRPLSAREVTEDVQQNQRQGWIHHPPGTPLGAAAAGGGGQQQQSQSYRSAPSKAELDSHARAAALQRNAFLRPQSGAGQGNNLSSSPSQAGVTTTTTTTTTKHKGLRAGDTHPDAVVPRERSGKQYAPDEVPGYRVSLSAKHAMAADVSAKAALHQAFALASTTAACQPPAGVLNPRPKISQHTTETRPSSNSQYSPGSAAAGRSAVRNPNYTPNRPYNDVTDHIAGGGRDVVRTHSSPVSAPDSSSAFTHKMSYPITKPLSGGPLYSPKSAQGSLVESPKPPLSKLVTNGRVDPLARSPAGGLGGMAGVEESGLTLQNLTASSLLNTKMRKMPVTNTLTGTLYYKKSFREAAKAVEKKNQPVVLEQRPRGDGAPAKPPALEKKLTPSEVDEGEEEDDDTLSTPSGERLPGDGEASTDGYDDDDDGIDDLYNDNDDDEDNSDDSDDYTICSSLSQCSTSTSTVNLRSAASRPSTTQSARSPTVAGEERMKSFVRPLTSSGETVVQPALRPSLFPAIPPTINFVAEGEKVEQLPWEIRKFLKWRMSPITPNIVKSALSRSNFRITKKNHDWLGCFGKHMKALAFKSLREYQKLNHFPGSFQLGRKDRLWRNLSKMQVSFGKKEFGFFPQTYVLPQDLKQLKRTWEDASSRQKWIIKPPASARGIGIKVINKWNQIPRKRPVIVQKYLGKPLLINDSKFDMRIYVYVSSYDPLRAYVFEDGLARFASCKYSNSMKNLSNKYMHLTNYSINKRNQDYQSNTDDSVCQGHKWSLKSLWNYLKKQGVNTQAVWDNIKDIIVKTLICSEGAINSMIKSNVRSRYIVHELFGFDIMLDDQLRPWILEVNISPSLHSNSQLDINVKGQMIRDLLNIAGFRVPDKNDVTTGAHQSSSSSAHDLSSHIPSSDYCMDKRLFTNTLSPDERAKHAYFCHRHQDEHVLQGLLDTLTPDDVRILTESIDEDSRKGGFIRVFPTPSTHRYLRFFQQPRYYNLLLDQWVTRFNRVEQRGISILQSLSEDGLHLENPTENHHHQWTPPNSSAAMLSARDKPVTSPQKKDGLLGAARPSASVARLPKVRCGPPVAQPQNSITQATGSSNFGSLNSSPTRQQKPLDPAR